MKHHAIPYQVEVNGQSIPVYPVRVSAAPINHIWPGWQRSINQSEEAWFADFDLPSDGCPAEVRIRLLQPAIEDVELRPHKYAPVWKLQGKEVVFKLKRPEQLVLLVNGLHGALHIFANPPFVYEPRPDDIYFGPGVHEAGLIMPKSGQRLCLDRGAVVYGAIFVYQAENVEIIGRGVLDSSKIKCPKEAVAGEPGGEVMAEIAKLGFDFQKWYVGGNLVVFGSHQVTVSGIILVDSPSWSVIIRNHCRNVAIDNLKIVGQWRYNSDGVDVCASSHVTLRNSFIRTFDDCIVARAPWLWGETEPVRDFLSEHCVLWCDWGKNLEIWNGDKESLIEDIVFRDIAVAHATDFIISITTRYGAEDILVRRVLYEDIEVQVENFCPRPLNQVEDCPNFPENDTERLPQLVIVHCGVLGRSLGNQGIAEASAEEKRRVRLRYSHLLFRNIRTLGRPLEVQIEGEPGILDIADVQLENVPFGKLSAHLVKELTIR